MSQHVLPFGDRSAFVATSEAQFLDALRNAARPFCDAAFTTRKNVHSRSRSVRIGGLIVATAAGSPVHLETASDRQFTLLMPTAGRGRIAEGARTIPFGGRQVILSSYCNPLVLDYEDYAGLTIRPDMDRLLGALHVEPDRYADVRELLLCQETHEMPVNTCRIDYYAVFRAVVGMIDKSDCNEAYLERIGLEDLLTNLIASLTSTFIPDVLAWTRRH